MMKKHFPLILLVLCLFSSCKENRMEKQAERFAGNYVGEFTSTRSGLRDTLNVPATLTFMQDGGSLKDMVLNPDFHLSRVDEESGWYYAKYEMPFDSLSSESIGYLRDACHLDQLDSLGYVYMGQFDAAKITARFYTNTVAVEMVYRKGEDIIGRTRFTGSR